MDATIVGALERDTLVDITTVGRRTGAPRRVEIWHHWLDGRLYITGSPGPRGWYANLVAQPDFTFHLKQSVQRDIPARATPITDPAERREVFDQMRASEERMAHRALDEWVKRSPLVVVQLDA